MQAISSDPTVSPKALAAELLEFWHSLMKGTMPAVWKVFDELGLTMTHVKTLHILDGCGRELTVKEVAERMEMSLPNASRTADALLHKGLIERREDPDDRRVKRIGISPAGHDAVQRIDSARLQGLESWTETLSPEQRVVLHAALSSLPHKDSA